MKILLTFFFLASWSIAVTSQDTFSIVAVDLETGEVGSAGASCVDLFQIPGFEPDFLSDLIPGEGAINSQAFWNPTNQRNALSQFQMGKTPREVVDWLIGNWVIGNWVIG